jgi:ribokinase
MMSELFLKTGLSSPYRAAAGVGGIGTGLFFALEGTHTLGRNESRPGRLLDVRDYCKLHIILHYVSVLLGADPSGDPFRTVPIGKVGADAAGERLLKEINAAGMDSRFVETVQEHPTLLSVCFQYPDGSGGNITTSASAAGTLTPAEVDRAAGFLQSLGGRYIAVATPEVPLEPRKRLLEIAGAHGAFCAASFTSAEIETARAEGFFEMLDMVALNEDEAGAFGGEFDPAAPDGFLEGVRGALTRINPAIRIVVTAGRDGAFAWDGTQWEHCPAPAVTVASTAGAGDALLAGILACTAAGIPLTVPRPPRRSLSDAPLASALDLAVLLAGFTVTSPHTIHPGATLGALTEFAKGNGLVFGDPLRQFWSG